VEHGGRLCSTWNAFRGWPLKEKETPLARIWDGKRTPAPSPTDVTSNGSLQIVPTKENDLLTAFGESKQSRELLRHAFERPAKKRIEIPMLVRLKSPVNDVHVLETELASHLREEDSALWILFDQEYFKIRSRHGHGNPRKPPS
jgi:hypothetical protein